MRTEIIDYVQGLNLGTFTVSTELPYTESGQAMYVKNPKRIYVDEEQITSEPIIQALDGLTVIDEETSVTIFFSVDSINCIERCQKHHNCERSDSQRVGCEHRI
jgi:hypothetical protein